MMLVLRFPTCGHPADWKPVVSSTRREDRAFIYSSPRGCWWRAAEQAVSPFRKGAIDLVNKGPGQNLLAQTCNQLKIPRAHSSQNSLVHLVDATKNTPSRCALPHIHNPLGVWH